MVAVLGQDPAKERGACGHNDFVRRDSVDAIVATKRHVKEDFCLSELSKTRAHCHVEAVPLEEKDVRGRHRVVCVSSCRRVLSAFENWDVSSSAFTDQ